MRSFLLASAILALKGFAGWYWKSFIAFCVGAMLR